MTAINAKIMVIGYENFIKQSAVFPCSYYTRNGRLPCPTEYIYDRSCDSGKKPRNVFAEVTHSFHSFDIFQCLAG